MGARTFCGFNYWTQCLRLWYLIVSIISYVLIRLLKACHRRPMRSANSTWEHVYESDQCGVSLQIPRPTVTGLNFIWASTRRRLSLTLWSKLSFDLICGRKVSERCLFVCSQSVSHRPQRFHMQSLCCRHRDKPTVIIYLRWWHLHVLFVTFEASESSATHQQLSNFVCTSSVHHHQQLFMNMMVNSVLCLSSRLVSPLYQNSLSLRWACPPTGIIQPP